MSAPRRELLDADHSMPYLEALETARPYITRATVPACTALATGLRLLWEEAAKPATIARQLTVMADSALRSAEHGIPGAMPEL